VLEKQLAFESDGPKRVMPGPRDAAMPPGSRPRRVVQTAPLIEEQALLRLGYRSIAGMDEAGRGSWAGPVVAAAVILPLDEPELSRRLVGVRDSKLLTAMSRARLFDIIQQHAVDVSVAMASPADVDRMNVLEATKLAMRQALAGLSCTADCLLLDAVRLDGVPLPQWPIVGGDRRSLTVAAASIVAKVTRDRYMLEAQTHYPDFRFGSHKGYGTAGHQAELQRSGPSNLHRRSFAPIRRLIEGMPL